MGNFTTESNFFLHFSLYYQDIGNKKNFPEIWSSKEGNHFFLTQQFTIIQIKYQNLRKKYFCGEGIPFSYLFYSIQIIKSAQKNTKQT